MPQPDNRLERFRYIFEQVRTTKTAQPNATPETFQPVSDTLLDAVSEMLSIAHQLEEGKRISLANLAPIMKGLQEQYLIYKEGKPIPRLRFPVASLPAPIGVAGLVPESATSNGTADAPPKPSTHGVTNVKVNITGRPDSVAESGDLVTLIMRYTPKLPVGFPKGVPQPSGATTTYRVFVGKKQWNKVAKVMTIPEDSLFIEGTGLLEADAPGMISVYVTNVASKLDKMAQAEQKKLEAAKPSDAAAAPPTADQSEPA